MKARVFALSLVFAAAAASAAQAPRVTDARSVLPNFDSLLERDPVVLDSAALRRQERVRAARSAQGYASSFEPRLGTASFLWAPAGAARPQVSADAAALPEALGRAWLSEQSGLLGIDRDMVAEAQAFDARRTRPGTMVARFQQRIDGRDVFNRRLSVLMDREGQLVAIAGSFHPGRTVQGAFSLGKAEAVSAAIATLGGELPVSLLTSYATQGGYEWFASVSNATNYLLNRAVRVKPLYYPRAEGLEPAYYLEVVGALVSPDGTTGRTEAFGFIVSASSGELLFRQNLIAHAGGSTAYKYRVFADATGVKQPFDSPLGNGYVPATGGPGTPVTRSGATANLVELVSGPISTGDAWLPDGATTTTGNHVDAFLDTGPQLDPGIYITGIPFSWPGDGYVALTGDLRSTTTGPNTFDHPAVADADPSTADAQQAAIVNLFYMNNWLHDWWYDHGFDEAAGNAQADNYGRGGVAGDALNAQGQDSGGRNNANMLTPADGNSPRMQMYLFDGPVSGEVCQLAPMPNCPSGQAGEGYAFAGGSFGPQTFDVSGALAVPDDGSDPKSNGCNDNAPQDPLGLLPPLPGIPDATLAGKIALIDRGSCNFTTKAQYAMLSGAIGLVVVNNGDGEPMPMGNADIPIALPGISTDALYTVPSVMIRKDVGESLKTQLASGDGVTLHLNRQPATDYDGTFDNLVIAHEYFHYVSNRLVSDSSGLNNTQGGGMGEGWSDIAAAMLSLRPEDAAVEGNAQFHGAYPSGFYVLDSFYYGIRRMPYSWDFAKNSLTFKHIQNGVALDDVEEAQGQTAAPAAFGTDGASNAEVHNAGEVWANMVFNAYVALLNKPGLSFDEAQNRMKDYLICGLKMTPSSPTFTEARDGILSCALAADATDFNVMARAFARRGIGVEAVSPDRASTDNVGVSESYYALLAAAPTLADGIGSGAGIDACDNDGVLDAGETGELGLRLFNNGAYTVGQTVTGTLSTTTAGVSIADGGAVSFVAGGIGQTAVAKARLGLADGVSGPVTMNLQLALDAPANPDPAVRYPPTASFTLPANADITRSAARDTFENAGLSARDWSISSSGTTQVWTIGDHDAQTGSGQGWFAPDLGSPTELSLVTPEFSVESGAGFSFAFDHYYEFEAALVNWDGGVIDVSIDGGAWQDAAAAGASFSSGYTGTIQANGREGYTGDSGGVVHEVLSFGSALAGHTIRLRFTVATDSTGAAHGWIVDNVEVSGAGTPFYAVAAENGECLDDGEEEEPTGNTTPAARLTVSPASGVAPVTVALDASASSDADGDALTYVFNFGDGSTPLMQSSPTASHTYTAVGSYSASVTVKDVHGASSSAATTISAKPAAPPPPNAAPNASLTVSASNGEVPLAVSFDASGSHDTDGDAIVEYRFDFGDGSPIVKQAQPTTGHSYTAAGSFEASVTVVDAADQVSAAASVPITTTTTIVVTPASPGPVAALYVTPKSGRAPLAVSFDGSQSFDTEGKAISEYLFDFGDGSPLLTQSSPMASHVYGTPGSFKPTLKVKNSEGVVSAKAAEGSVSVTPATDTAGSSGGQGGGGALGSALLMMLLGGAALRQRRRA